MLVSFKGERVRSLNARLGLTLAKGVEESLVNGPNEEVYRWR